MSEESIAKSYEVSIVKDNECWRSDTQNDNGDCS